LVGEHREGILAAILKREELGSTGIGRGVAIPHAKHPCVANVVGAVAEFPGGVDFGSIDDQLVHLVCLLLAPADSTGVHLRILEEVTREL
jgi:mannitol/fructose-specific phosphotransferase system IIA component (Ntr-type)